MSARRPFQEELPDALELWQRQGLVSQGQARRILAYYGLAPQTVEEAGGRGRLASIVAILGAVLVGIGVILFVGSNWQHLDRYQRVGLLLAAMLAAYAAGFRLKYRPGNYPRIGASLIFLGTVVFGANLFLVAQIYHVSAPEPTLLAIWATGAFATAYAAASRPSLYLGIIVAVAWYGFQLAAWHIERLGASSLIGLAAFVSLGLLLVGVGEVQRSFRRTESFSAPFVRLGLVVTLAAVWVFSFADVWRAIGSMSSSLGSASVAGPALDYLIASFVLFSVVAAALAAWAFRRLGIDRTSVFEAAGVAVLLLSSLLVVFHPLSEAAHYAVVFNAVLLSAVVWAIILGVWSRREALINIGLAFFVLLVAARYFDFFFSFMDRSLAFIGGGLLLMGGGYLLERSRRRLLLSMRVEA
jgi:uncharacterized membrane protein